MKVTTDLDVRGALTVGGLPIAAGSGDVLGVWSSTVAYPAGSIVTYGGKTWGAPTDIAAGGAPPAASGAVVTNVPVGSDNFATAPAIAIATDGASASSVPYSNATFTTELSEPANWAHEKSSWTKYIPATSGTVTISTVGSSGDSVMAVYVWNGTSPVTFATLSTVASGDDNIGDDASASLSVTGGLTYYIQIGSYLSAVQDYVLNISSARATAALPMPWIQLAVIAPAAGSVILSGTATPTAGTGALGDYYLDTDDRVLYGPKVTEVAGTPESVYGSVYTGSGDTPSGSIGNDITINTSGTITGLRWQRQATGQTRTLRLWDSSGTQLAVTSPVTDAAPHGEWQVVSITPVAVAPGTYRVSMDAASGQVKVGTHATRTTTYQSLGGSYWGGTIGARPVAADARDMFVDLVFQVITTPAWPVALTSGISQTAADTRYVNVTGDTLTGSLVVDGGVGNNATTYGSGAISGKSDGSLAITANSGLYLYSGFLSMGGGAVHDVATPVGGTDAANKAYVDAAGGSTILSGTATPTGAVGGVGNYYLDTDNNILYGPKASVSYGAAENIIGVTPTASVTDATNFTLGMKFRALVDGRVTGVRFYRHASSGTTSRSVHLWSAAGSSLATATTSSESGSGWKTATFSSPVNLTAGTLYTVSFNNSASQQYYVVNTGVPVTSNTHFDSLEGKYAVAVSTFPAADDGPPGYNFYVDVNFEPAPLTAWPVALQSVPAGAGTILSGTATPTGAVGALGDYYLDTDDLVLYGPKAPAGTFAPDQYIEGGADANGQGYAAGPYVYGIKQRFMVAGRVTGIRLRVHASGNGNGWEVYLFNKSTGTLLASKDVSGLTPGAWTTVLFDTPVDVATNTTYIPAVWVPGGPSRQIEGLSGATGQTVGDIRNLADNEDGRVAVYSDTRDIAPATFSGAIIFQLSAVFRAVAPIWPVALKSIPPGGTTGQVLKKTSGSDYAVAWVT